jgi:hypothetical protein
VAKLKDLFQCKNLTPLFLFLIFISCCLAAGCGYHFRPAGRPIGIKLDSMAIPLFSSTSSFMGVEGEFTRIVREEFITHSRVRIEDKDKAQAVLSGRIHSITTEPLTYRITKTPITITRTGSGEKIQYDYLSTDEVTSSRTLKVRMDVKLTDTETGKIIWHAANLEGESSFTVSADPLLNRYNQRQALISIARDLATQIYSKTMERF